MINKILGIFRSDVPPLISVTLRDEKSASDSRRLTAELSAEHDLLIRGLDYGKEVERVFGSREYEWVWQVEAAHIPKLEAALAGTGSLLKQLQEQFSGEKAAGLQTFLESNQIPFDFWSRNGD